MSNVMAHQKRQMILRLLCEGNSLRSTARITGSDKKSIGKLILSLGRCCKTFLDEQLRDLNLRHIEVDEIWTFVQKKQARLTVEEKALEGKIGDVYLWTCIDQDSKSLVTYALSPYTGAMYALRDPECCLILGREVMAYAESRIH